MDTAGDLSEGWQDQYDIELIPINIIHDGKTYRQGIDITYEDFYRIVEEDSAIPSTSQPTPYQFIEFYRSIAKPGDQILSIHVTKKLSGTLDSAVQAAESLRGELEIFPYDSASGTICMGMLAKEARQLDRSGKSMQEIIQRLDIIRDQMELIFTLDTLKFASMSGRVKHLKAALASLLNIKPIIELKNGVIEMQEKTRSRRASIDLLLKKFKKIFGDQRIIVAVVHSHAPQEGFALLNKVIDQFNCAEAVLGEVSISLAAHFGPGALGLTAYPAP